MGPPRRAVPGLFSGERAVLEYVARGQPGMSPAFGRDADWIGHWKDEAARYHDQVGESRAAYHTGRLATADRLLDRAGLSAGARFVDFGCGDGVYTRRLASRGFTVVGLDVVAEMIVLARRQGQEGTMRFLTGGAAQLTAAGPCDAVV